MKTDVFAICFFICCLPDPQPISAIVGSLASVLVGEAPLRTRTCLLFPGRAEDTFFVVVGFFIFFFKEESSLAILPSLSQFGRKRYQREMCVARYEQREGLFVYWASEY